MKAKLEYENAGTIFRASDISITMNVYAHNTDKIKSETVNIFENVLTKRWQPAYFEAGFYFVSEWFQRVCFGLLGVYIKLLTSFKRLIFEVFIPLQRLKNRIYFYFSVSRCNEVFVDSLLTLDKNST